MPQPLVWYGTDQENAPGLPGQTGVQPSVPTQVPGQQPGENEIQAQGRVTQELQQSDPMTRNSGFASLNAFTRLLDARRTVAGANDRIFGPYAGGEAAESLRPPIKKMAQGLGFNEFADSIEAEERDASRVDSALQTAAMSLASANQMRLSRRDSGGGGGEGGEGGPVNPPALTAAMRQLGGGRTVADKETLLKIFDDRMGELWPDVSRALDAGVISPVQVARQLAPYGVDAREVANAYREGRPPSMPSDPAGGTHNGEGPDPEPPAGRPGRRLQPQQQEGIRTAPASAGNNQLVPSQQEGSDSRGPSDMGLPQSRLRPVPQEGSRHTDALPNIPNLQPPPGMPEGYDWAGAIRYLQQHPETAGQFDQYHGRGRAQVILRSLQSQEAR